MGNDVLKAMVDRLDKRGPQQRGYVTNRDEAIEILQGLTKHLSVGIYVTREVGDDISIELKAGFTLERSLLED